MRNMFLYTSFLSMKRLQWCHILPTFANCETMTISRIISAYMQRNAGNSIFWTWMPAINDMKQDGVCKPPLNGRVNLSNVPFHLDTYYHHWGGIYCFENIALKSPVWGCPICILWGGVQEEFGHNLVSCGLIWLTGFMGQPLFALGLTCVCFVSIDFLSLKGGPSANSIFFH